MICDKLNNKNNICHINWFCWWAWPLILIKLHLQHFTKNPVALVCFNTVRSMVYWTKKLFRLPPSLQWIENDEILVYLHVHQLHCCHALQFEVSKSLEMSFLTITVHHWLNGHGLKCEYKMAVYPRDTTTQMHTYIT